MTHSALILGLLAGPLLFLQGFEDLEEALKAVRKRRPLTGKVSASIAKEAVEESAEANGRRLLALAKVARAGKADKRLARTLLTRFVDEPDGDKIVLEVLGRLPRKVVDPIAVKFPQARQMIREQLVAKKERLPRHIAQFYVRLEEPKTVARQLQSWANADKLPRGYRVLVRELPLTTQPKELFLALLAVKVPTPVEDGWVRALSHLVYAHDEVLEDVVDLLDDPATRQRARLLGVVGNEPHNHDEAHGKDHVKAHEALRKRVHAHVKKAALNGRGLERARALGSVQRLGLHALLPDVIRAVGDQNEDVQAAAVTALPDLLKARLHFERGRDEKPDPKKIKRNSDKVRALVHQAATEALQNTRGSARIAALLTARRLRLRGELRRVVGPIAADTQADKPLRLAALRCFSGVMPRDVKTIDLLLKLMEDKDRDIATGAWRAIQGVARVRLPFRMRLWKSWRGRVKLPE